MTNNVTDPLTLNQYLPPQVPNTFTRQPNIGNSVTDSHTPYLPPQVPTSFRRQPDNSSTVGGVAAPINVGMILVHDRPVDCFPTKPAQLSSSGMELGRRYWGKDTGELLKSAAQDSLTQESMRGENKEGLMSMLLKGKERLEVETIELVRMSEPRFPENSMPVYLDEFIAKMSPRDEAQPLPVLRDQNDHDEESESLESDLIDHPPTTRTENDANILVTEIPEHSHLYQDASSSGEATICFLEQQSEGAPDLQLGDGSHNSNQSSSSFRSLDSEFYEDFLDSFSSTSSSPAQKPARDKLEEDLDRFATRTSGNGELIDGVTRV